MRSIAIIMLFTMNLNIIFLSIAVWSASGTKFRKTYQDQTSWAFQHPTVRYSQSRFDKDSVTTLASMPIDTQLDVSMLIK